MSGTLTRRSPGLYDRGAWTVSLGSDWLHDGPHRPFRVRLSHRVTIPGGGAPRGDGTCHDGRRVDAYTVLVPALPFRWAFRLRRLGMMAVYGKQQRFLYWLATL